MLVYQHCRHRNTYSGGTADQPRGRQTRDEELADRPSCWVGVHVHGLEKGFGMAVDEGQVWNELISRCEDVQSVRRDAAGGII